MVPNTFTLRLCTTNCHWLVWFKIDLIWGLMGFEKRPKLFDIVMNAPKETPMLFAFGLLVTFWVSYTFYTLYCPRIISGDDAAGLLLHMLCSLLYDDER